jgi:hypothetical protein
MSILKEYLIYEQNENLYSVEERRQIRASFEKQCNEIIKRHTSGYEKI